MRVWIRPAPSSAVADRAHAPVHHVGGGDDVDARLRLDHRLPHEHCEGGVVGDVALADHAVMAVIGVRVERHVTHQRHVRKRALQQPRRAAHQVLRVAGLRALGILLLGRRRGEQGDGRDAELHALRHVAREPVERDAHHAGHGGDIGHRVAALGDEHRPDQVIDGKPRLRDQPAGGGVVAVAARARRGKAAERHRAGSESGGGGLRRRRPGANGRAVRG